MALTEKDKAILQEMQEVANEYIALAKQYEMHLNEEEWKQMEQMEKIAIDWMQYNSEDGWHCTYIEISDGDFSFF